LDVDYGTVTSYVGNYARFVVEKAAVRERKEVEIGRQQKIIAEKRAFVERFGAKASKAKQAQSRMKQIEKIEVEELAQTSRREPLFRFTQERPSGKEVLELEGISKAYGDKVVLKNVSLTVRRGEKLAVIGANGLGKSTLLKIIMERLKADQGKIRLGHEVRLGYFAQDHHELLGSDKQTPLDFIWETVPSEGTATVRGMLGRVLFSGDDVMKPVGSLSGGEAARLIFCKIIAEKPNVLVLDEPTNHLDLEAISALVEGLKAFEGTVIFVSHDRSFVSELATRILEVTPEGPREFSGTYAEYLARAGDDHLDIDAVSLKAKTANANSGNSAGNKGSTPPPGLSWEEQKKRRNRLGTLPSRRDKLLAQIEAAEARKKAIADSYTTAGFFERTSAAELEQLERENRTLSKQIEDFLAEWETVESEIAKITAG